MRLSVRNVVLPGGGSCPQHASALCLLWFCAHLTLNVPLCVNAPCSRRPLVRR